MNAIAPNSAAPNVAVKDEWKQIVVCTFLPHPVIGDSAMFYDVVGAQIFYQYLELQLRHRGVELFDDPERKVGTAVQISQAVAWFKVRDLAKALRVLADGLQAILIKEFCAIVYFDKRENLWRVLWPAKPLFDPHQVIEKGVVRDDAKTQELIARLFDYSKAIRSALSKADDSDNPPDSLLQ
jgi:hypothetical protein